MDDESIQRSKHRGSWEFELVSGHLFRLAPFCLLIERVGCGTAPGDHPQPLDNDALSLRGLPSPKNALSTGGGMSSRVFLEGLFHDRLVVVFPVMEDERAVSLRWVSCKVSALLEDP